MSKYNRVLLKLSGESLAGKSQQGIDPEMLGFYVTQIDDLISQGVQVGVVVGGGNIFRGIQGTGKGIDRVQGDYMGMLATIINGMALQGALQNAGIEAALLSGLPVDPVCSKMNAEEAIMLLEEGFVVIMVGGTGNPYFTTDSAAALRALETKADVLLKGTRVDGVYTADPEKDPSATKLDKISFDEALNKNLAVMDMTAFTLCKENKLPIRVFDINKKNNLKKIVSGENIGTLITG